jgi:AsmA protein
MKKIGIVIAAVIGAIIVVLVVAVVALPRLIDWNGYKPEIAQAVRDATGRELRIDGDIELSVLPDLSFRMNDIRFANAPESNGPEMLTLASVSGKMGLLPLLGRKVVVENLVIEAPALFLEVMQNGQANWVFETAEAAPAEGPEEAGALPFKALTVGDVRLENGSITYRDALSGQFLEARDINLAVALEDLESPLSLDGGLTLNERPVTLALSAETPGALLAEQPARVTAKLRCRDWTGAWIWTFPRWGRWRPGWVSRWIRRSRTRAR